MPYNRVSARKLLNAGEYELFEASTAAALKELAEPRLRQKIERARKLRDKYADLLRRQKISTRRRTGAKAGKSGVANARTGQKQQVFAEVLERFEGRLKRPRRRSEQARRSCNDGAAAPSRQTQSSGGAARLP